MIKFLEGFFKKDKDFPFGVIDIHSHVLFGIDDGAERIEDSVKMILEAKSNGITHIVSTPHYFPGSKAFKNQLQNDHLQKLNDYSIEHQIGIEVLAGNELYLAKGAFEEIISGRCKTLAGTKFVLVEFSMREKPLQEAKDELNQIIHQGYKPIIAHPEKYAWVMDELHILKEYMKKGCRLQLTAASLAGYSGTKIYQNAMKLIEKDLVYCIAEDAHKPESDRTAIKKVFNKLLVQIGEDKAIQLFLSKERLLKDAGER